MTTVHFVGFRGDEYHNAVKIWGIPDFIHRFWDVRAAAEAQPDDIVVFARVKDWNSQYEPRKESFDDSAVM